MIDSEACRFALSHYGVAFDERAHVFGWASILALWYGWTVQIPVLHGDRCRLADPRQIVEHFDAVCPPQRKLLPADTRLAKQVIADWNRFNWTLGFAAATFSYFHLLPHRELMIEPFSRGVPDYEAPWMRSAYPFFSGMFRLILRLCNERRARVAAARILSIFDETDRRLSDGRRYLVGDHLTLADIGLATSAGPLILPEGYASPMPPLERMPPAMTAMRAELAQRLTAEFVHRIYREHRVGLACDQTTTKSAAESLRPVST
jgi:glutathione S-transferase